METKTLVKVDGASCEGLSGPPQRTWQVPGVGDFRRRHRWSLPQRGDPTEHHQERPLMGHMARPSLGAAICWLASGCSCEEPRVTWVWPLPVAPQMRSSDRC